MPRRAPPMFEALSETLYVQLRTLADREMRRERRSHTLSATALVHEALLRVERDPGAPAVEDNAAVARRTTLMRVASVAMRRVLVEHARARLAEKRGAGQPEHRRIDLDSIGAVADLASESQSDVMLAFDAALTRLEAVSPSYAEVVRLRFFAGLSIAEVAALLGVSERTVNNHWLYARAWLARELGSLDAT
ncbi:MAG: ECF-type sigma factor [Planctomycetota bacterium]